MFVLLHRWFSHHLQLFSFSLKKLCETFRKLSQIGESLYLYTSIQPRHMKVLDHWILYIVDCGFYTQKEREEGAARIPPGTLPPPPVYDVKVCCQFDQESWWNKGGSNVVGGIEFGQGLQVRKANV
ncbi:unnamed protein product [Vicia faba]|uniref:Uncharacterized protein n=1 Tax=Vicia faba TaxID=3906 RepID=A0AAV0YQW1_VICFA|nr:unnamed protein product [Vicia faba]